MAMVLVLVLAELLFFALLVGAVAFLPALGRRAGYGVTMICPPCREQDHAHCDRHYWSLTAGQRSCPCQHRTGLKDMIVSEVSDFPTPSPNGQNVAP